MPIISSDYEGSTAYSFAASGTNVVLKANTVYNYTGYGAAFLMNTYYAHFLVAGIIYSNDDGINFNSYGSYIDVAATGMVIGTSGSGIVFTAGSGAVTINNSGTIEGQGGIVGGEATNYVDIYNSGLIQSDREYIAAIATGSAGDQVINTGTIIGNISTGAGSDTIDTHLGTFTGFIDGGAGSDTYTVADGQKIREGYYYQPDGDDGAVDTVNSYGNFTLGEYLESLNLLGAATIGRGNELNNTIQGNDNGNRLFGGDGIDQLVAGSGDDVLRGGAGGDILSSLEGSDQFFGGDGNDILQSGLEKVTMNGGAGLDVAAFLYNDTALVVDFTLATGRVKGGVAQTDVLISIEGVWGSQFDDKMTGDAGANNFLGYLGNDVLSGGGGDDTLEGYAGADTLDGGDGIDTLSYAFDFVGVNVSLLSGTASGGDAQGDTFTNFENLTGGSRADTLTGSSGANVLSGGDGDDVLSAGANKDTLIGGSGNDTLTGGIQTDLFVFADPIGYYDIPSTLTFGQDTITDFQDGQDRISFIGNSDVHSLADLTISQSGSNTVVLVTGTTDQITLLNFSAVNFNSADVIFG